VCASGEHHGGVINGGKHSARARESDCSPSRAASSFANLIGILSERQDSRMVEAQTHVFRASLSPRVYRDLEISSGENLYDLAEAIVRLFGFDFDHAFGFYSKLTGRIFNSPVKYELFADMGESEARSVKRTRIVDAFPEVGAKMTFLFDYGDNWQFRIEVIGQKRKEPGVRYLRLLKAIGKAPEQYPDPDDE
jgi:Plasmid pRiA4b ORF-3-like protein